MPVNLAPITVESDFDPAQTSHYISFGAGVQSTVLYLMAARGDFLPLPAAAIFADTGWETQQVYDHLDWVESLGLPVPIVRVQAANLYSNLWDAKRAPGQGQTPFTDIPAFVYTPEGNIAMRRRQCTQHYKIEPIIRQVKAIVGRKPRTRHNRPPFAVQWLGISTDEWMRCKDARQGWIKNAYPLIEAGMSRSDCVSWFGRNYPGRPLVKSSCVGCPYHSSREWLRLYRNQPEDMADTILLDERLREPERIAIENKGRPQYLHRSGRPLAEVLPELDRLDLMQPRLLDNDQDGFGNECDGYCNT